DAADLLTGCERLGPWPCRLSADIDNVSARFVQASAGRDRVVGIEPPPAIGEAVGRHVEHAHEERAVESEPGPRRAGSRDPRELLSGPLCKTGALIRVT